MIGGAVREFACSRTSSTGPAPSTGVSILGAYLPGRCLIGVTLCKGRAHLESQQRGIQCETWQGASTKGHFVLSYGWQVVLRPYMVCRARVAPDALQAFKPCACHKAAIPASTLHLQFGLFKANMPITCNCQAAQRLLVDAPGQPAVLAALLQPSHCAWACHKAVPVAVVMLLACWPYRGGA